MEKIVFVCCLHGNERYGLEVVKKLPAFPYFLANEQAMKENKRFIDVDMNRCFPGNKNGNYEERQAINLLDKVKDFDYLIDLHSSSNICPLFGIITKPNNEKIGFAKKLGLKRVVIMTESFASGRSLIDSAKCGISLEVGPHKRKENIKDVLELIENFSNDILYEDPEVFEVFDIIKKLHKSKILISNFQEVKKGQVIAENSEERQIADFDFIPVLVGEEAYNGVLCLACRKNKNL